MTDEKKEPAPELAQIAVEAWALLENLRLDRVHGFLYHVRTKGLGTLTRPEWSALWEQFQKRPVK